jgi:hypothetical protein
MRGETALTLGRIAAKRHDLGHTGGGIGFGDVQRFRAGRVHTGQMCRDRDTVIGVDRLDRIMGQRPRRAARPIGDRDEFRGNGRQHIERFPQAERALERFGREKLERNAGRAGHDISDA